MKSYSSMGLSGEERGYTEKRIRAGEKPAPTIKRLSSVEVKRAVEDLLPCVGDEFCPHCLLKKELRL